MKRAQRSTLAIDDWNYVPFSERRVVETLILRRGEYLTDEIDEVRTTYVAFDQLCAGAGLDREEAWAVAYLGEGGRVKDYDELAGVLERAVDKIVAANNRRWMEVYGICKSEF